ncbi:LSU ribosomal protein L22P [Thermoplasmatales archaeon SCGC AB-539-N05]|nr:LSU ribosomal protein L22P [Thermoplasmatales archaeon SCGC AB-539-N05]ENO12171.1 LSU ribosomal protein L22P [Thermoplasmatales archaeon SCGC AB-539-C06]
MLRYSVKKDPDKTAKAYGYEFHCSPKHSMNIIRVIRGMKTNKAKTFLEDVIAMKRPVPFIYHKRKTSHRKGHVGPGGYPKKASEHVLKVIKNAENNAEYKGLDVDNMIISHISTYEGRKIKGTMPRAHGRATDKNEQTTDIEIIIEEVE